MGDIISIYEDYKEIMAGDHWTPPILSNKTIYFYVTPIERKKYLQSALNRKCIRRRRMKVSTWPPMRTKMQRISNDIVKGNMLVTDSDQYIIPANSEVPKFKVKKFYRRKKINQDKQLAVKRNCLLRYNLDIPNMKIFKNIEMPAIPCFWQFIDIYPDIYLLFTGANNRCLLPVKKCYNIEMNNLSHNFGKFTAISCGKFRIMLINSTWRRLAKDSLVEDPYCEGKKLEVLKYRDLPFCILCMVNKDAYVKRDYQSPPRECVGCRLYRDEKGSNDDLVQWAKHSQLIHSQNSEEGHNYDIKLSARGQRVAFAWVPGHIGVSGNERADEAAKLAASTQADDATPIRPIDIQSPVSQNSREGIHLKSTPGSGCCSDSEDGHEKRTIPEDRYSFKKRRTDPEEESLKCEGPGGIDSREFPPYTERSVSAPGSRGQNDGIPNYKNRFPTKERQGRSLRSPHTNSDRALVFAADPSPDKPAKRIEKIVALREELAMRFKQKEDERKKYIEANRGRWVRETVITALSEGEGDPADVSIKSNIKNTLVSQVNNNEAVLLATLSALSCNNVQDVDDNMTVTTFEKSLHSEETSLGKNRLIKKTVIKIEKNESNAKASVGTHLRIEDRLRISSAGVNNKLKQIKSGNNVSLEGDELTNLPVLGSVADAKSNETVTRPSTGKSRSATGGSDCSSSRRLKKNFGKLSRKSSSQRSSQHRSVNSSALSTSPVVSKTKMLYRSQVNRKSTLIMDLFSDQLKENRSVKSVTSTDVTKDSNTTLTTLSNTPKLDHVQPPGERRALTASTNLKKTQSQSKYRPRSVTNSTPRRTPTARSSNKSLIPSLRSQRNLTRVSSNLQARRIERPPSRKPIHVSPVASSTAERKISDNNLERTAKNKYTLRKNSLAKRPSLKSSIENSLKINQIKQCNNNEETESKRGTTLGNTFRKTSMSTPGTPVKQIKTVKSVPAKIDQISKDTSSNGRSDVRSSVAEGNVSRKIPKVTPLSRPTSSSPRETSRVTKSAQPTKTQVPKQPKEQPVKNDKDSNWWKKWNAFSAPNARNGHPLKSMTLAEFQAKRHTKISENNNNAPPPFIKSARVAIMSDRWGNRESGIADSKPIENENASSTTKENKISEPKQGEKGHIINVDHKQSKTPIKDIKLTGQNKNITDIKVEQPSSKINNSQLNVKEENEKSFESTSF